MNSDNNIYSALKLPFSNIRYNLGDKICSDVNAIVQELKRRNMSKQELTALKSCYEAAYQDSIGSCNVIVSSFTFFVGIDIVNDLSLSTEIHLMLKFALLLFWLLYAYYKIQKLCRENISLRNHIMAVSILLAENK